MYLNIARKFGLSHRQSGSPIRDWRGIRPPRQGSNCAYESERWGMAAFPVALGQADDIFLKQLEEPDLGPLTSWLMTLSAQSSADRDVFEDAVFDISLRLEEYRYETGMAAAYSIGLKAELAEKQFSGPTSIGIPSSVRALLAPYIAHLPLPRRLFTDPADPISGFRLLGGWWAGAVRHRFGARMRRT